MSFPIEILASQAQFSKLDLVQINQCRSELHRLGFAYQLAWVRLHNRFMQQEGFEILPQLLDYVAFQLDVEPNLIHAYEQSGRTTIALHQNIIREYLGLEKFSSKEKEVSDFIFEMACYHQNESSLYGKVDARLRQLRILKPGDSVLYRVIRSQRTKAHDLIIDRIADLTDNASRTALDQLLVTEGKFYSDFQRIKQSPSGASVNGILTLLNKIELIRNTGVLDLNIEFVSEPIRLHLARTCQSSDANRMRSMTQSKRYAALICFLHQKSQEALDQMIQSFDKVMVRLNNQAKKEVEAFNKSKSRQIKSSLKSFSTIGAVVLDETISESEVRARIFETMDRRMLESQVLQIALVLNSKFNNSFNLVKQRYGFLRQFTPRFLDSLNMITDSSNDALLENLRLLKELNSNSARNVPSDINLDFVPNSLLPMVKQDNQIDRAGWECAILSRLHEEIKSGNYAIESSKSYCRFEDFFIPKERWENMRLDFFARASLPASPQEASTYITNRLRNAYDKFLHQVEDNDFASINSQNSRWEIKRDPALQLSSNQKISLIEHKEIFRKEMRSIKLPDLLIEVDNDLGFSHVFLDQKYPKGPEAQQIKEVLVTIMAHGCNLGPYTMSRMVEGVSYRRIKHISDWLLTQDNLRKALAKAVNGISDMDLTQCWGKGSSSSSDGQRFAMRRKALQQSYSQQCRDYALEFYTFIADNYAPFYSLPIECKDRDAPFVLDGLLYNESKLEIEEHYVDSHGYTENNFAAFAMYGKRFAPRIKGIGKQRIYKIEKDYDYGVLSPLLKRSDRQLHLDWITKQWDRLGHFYASLELGYTTASMAMKRLNGFSVKNHFYRANREFGRVIKTEFILDYMSDKNLRIRTRRGVLKGEELHSLVRALRYGKLGKIDRIDADSQRYSANCLTLILAAIVYWQTKEMSRVIAKYESQFDFDPEILGHISPIQWDNILMYGSYVIDPDKIRILQ